MIRRLIDCLQTTKIVNRCQKVVVVRCFAIRRTALYMESDNAPSSPSSVNGSHCLHLSTAHPLKGDRDAGNEMSKRIQWLDFKRQPDKQTERERETQTGTHRLTSIRKQTGTSPHMVTDRSVAVTEKKRNRSRSLRKCLYLYYLY